MRRAVGLAAPTLVAIAALLLLLSSGAPRARAEAPQARLVVFESFNKPG